MKSRFYKIKCTAASNQVLSYQPKIVILNNIYHVHPITSKLILCFHQILFPSFPYSWSIDSRCSLVLDHWTFGKYLRTDHLTCRGVLLCFASFKFFFSDITRVRIFFFLSRKAQFFFQNSTLSYMTKTLNQIIFYFLHQNQNIFFSNIGNQNIFLEKTI